MWITRFEFFDLTGTLPSPGTDDPPLPPRCADYEAIWKAKSPPPTYEGRDRNSVWRAAAAERIERFREGDLIGPEMPVRVEAIAELAPDVAAAFDE